LTSNGQQRTQIVFALEGALSEPEQQDTKPHRVGVREFRKNLTRFLRQVRQGSSFLVMSHEQVLAEVRPPPRSERPRRRPGALRGKIRMAPDFDTLPPEVLAAIEGNEV
jgi:antitoxin (DNA-binding transcriptional repressor) of toxin-antitoxin stability system